MDYLLFRTRQESNQEIRAYKSWDAFAQFACKWIEAVLAKQIGNNFLILSKVRHSQSVSKVPLKPWVILGPTGLGEVCTHVADVLFSLEYAGRDEEKSVTDVLAYWIGPSKKGQFYKRLGDIDFTPPGSLLESSEKKENIKPVPEIPVPSTEEIEKTYIEFKKAKCLTVSMLPKKKYHPETLDTSLPKSYNNFFDTSFLDLTLEQVRAKIKDENLLNALVLTDEQINNVFDKTKDQSASTLWFQLRGGRITASKFKAACRTSLEKPSLSLLKGICYPLTTKLFFKAGVYGCEHEQDALNAYLEAHKEEHSDAVIRKSGLILNKKYPFFGASPDGILECSLCGTGCVEVKCPYCVRDTDIEEIIHFKTSCLVADKESFSLKRDHSYYYQVQMQMALGAYTFCDFVVWTKHSFFYERIEKNDIFWKEESSKAENFFEHVVLPELFSKIYTEKIGPRILKEKQIKTKEATPVLHTQIQLHQENLDTQCTAGPSSSGITSGMTQAAGQCVNTQLWCYCRKAEDGKRMVNCGNPFCKIQWFHRKCLNVKRLRTADWFCSDCANISKDCKEAKRKKTNN